MNAWAIVNDGDGVMLRNILVIYIYILKCTPGAGARVKMLNIRLHNALIAKYRMERVV